MEEEQVKKRGNSRNRDAGHIWERLIARKLRELGFHDIKCSRECSRLRDSKKVDLCNADEDTSGRFPLNIQAKSYNTHVKYAKLLKELEDHNGRKQVNVVFHKLTEKSIGGKFMPKGEFAILNLDDFYTLFTEAENYKKGFDKLAEYFDCIPDADRKEASEYLTKIGL